MSPATRLHRFAVVASLFLSTLGTMSSAHASDFEPFPRGMPIEEAALKLKVKGKAWKDVASGIYAVWQNPAMQRLKQKMSEPQLQCFVTRLWLAGYKALSAGMDTFSPLAKKALYDIDYDILRLEGLESHWCDDQDGDGGADHAFDTMRRAGIKLYVPNPDKIADAKVKSSGPAATLYQGLMAAGILVGQSASQGAAALTDALPSGAILFFDPALFFNPTKKTDPRQVQ